LIEYLADRIAVKIKEASPEETASTEVMKYALIGLLHNGIIVGTALAAGLILGKFFDILWICLSFMLLRLISGGYHFKSALACFVFSTVIFIGIPFIPVSDGLLPYLNSVSLVLCAVFAPSNIREHIRVPDKYFIWFKIGSVLVVALNFTIDNPLITLSFLAQSMTLIHFRREEVNKYD